MSWEQNLQIIFEAQLWQQSDVVYVFLNTYTIMIFTTFVLAKNIIFTCTTNGSYFKFKQ